MTGWQPMETAPKDGTRILAYVSRKADEANICEIWWEPEYAYDNWCVFFGWWDDDWDLCHEPIAWMPKPPPPPRDFTADTQEDQK